jgi:hypothetical protein
MEHFSKRRAIGFCAVLALLAGCGGHGAVIPSQPEAAGQGSFQNGRMPGVNGQFELRQLVPRFLTLPSRNVDFATLDAQRAASRTIPFYTGMITSPLNKVTYSYSIAGSDPTKSNATTTVLYKPILLRIHFADGTVLDPTKPGCGDTVSVANRFFKGPNFVPVALTSNGVNVGKVQISDGFERAEFWKILKGPGFHLVLKAAAAPAVVDVTAPGGASGTKSGVCAGKNHNVGGIEESRMADIIIRIAKQRAKTNQIAYFLTYNVFSTNRVGKCCYLGFHSSFGTAGGTQVFTIAAYNDKGVFPNDPGMADIATGTHEFELLDDPFPGDSVNGNNVPPWGGVGQIEKGSCFPYLETGDPLTGTQFEVRYNGFTYHPQELAFFSWFFRTPSIGTGGKYSFRGTFTHGKQLCRVQ